MGVPPGKWEVLPRQMEVVGMDDEGVGEMKVGTAELSWQIWSLSAAVGARPPVDLAILCW